jgi:glycosyltransferase involved in cell wall biosynthesis
MCIPSLRGGGAERVFSILAGNFDNTRFSVHLLTLSPLGVYHDDLPNHVCRESLGTSGVRKSFFKIIRRVKTTAPDVILSTLPHMNKAIGLVSLFIDRRIKLIARESSVPTMGLYRKKPIMRLLHRIPYRFFDAVVCLNEHMRNDFVNNSGFPNKRLSVIPNPVDTQKIRKLGDAGVRKHHDKIEMMCAGRLVEDKGFDLSLRVTAALDEKYVLRILGEGPDRKKLEMQAGKLGIAHRVFFEGFQKNPFHYYMNADVFLLTSRREGFPNTLLEAMACGLPVVAFRCHDGIAEIVKDGVTGYVVDLEDIRGMSLNVKSLAKAPLDAQTIIDSVRERYELNIVVKQYERLIEQVVGE